MPPPPSEHAVLTDAADEAGEPYQQSITRSPGPWHTHVTRHHPALQIGDSLLRLVMFMRGVLTHATFCRQDDDDDDGPSWLDDHLRRNKVRRKPRCLAVRALQLGPHKIARTDEVDIVAKFLYNKPRRIVCELCRHGGFARIDILCSNIRLMQACFDHARFDTLKIHVKSSSHRYRAERAPPGRHRRWERCTDFTPKTFCLQFEKGTLERCYGKMLYTDPPLILLTLSPPPGQEEEEAQATDTQIFTAHPVLPPFASTNTGATFVMHEYGDEDA
ncbi:uncharacterized protein LOC104582431 [Brachypodium distachyon]|uniref:uncharacterized protein LOC104582431 n=1 Tax=Brachypodium distachyon TaxID=15368 RepID=UPI000530047D|nr:uncharacterized protein LOC104582431 [Brachypodium distachyon]|eukprot:XP_014753404.2 uncharacterized protein LOC104582431 [Brachypodium distachyon]